MLARPASHRPRIVSAALTCARTHGGGRSGKDWAAAEEPGLCMKNPSKVKVKGKAIVQNFGGLVHGCIKAGRRYSFFRLFQALQDLRNFAPFRCVGCSRLFPTMFSNWIPTFALLQTQFSKQYVSNADVFKTSAF